MKHKTPLMILALLIIAVGLFFWTSRKQSPASITDLPQRDLIQASSIRDSANESPRDSIPRSEDPNVAYLLEAFEAGDAAQLRARVKELLERDFEAALEAFAVLDYTFLHYQMIFPHDVVSDYLEAHYTGPETMEIFAPYLKHSSILHSVLGTYFDRWVNRDHRGQFEWFQKNSSFNDDGIIAGYVEAIGNSENGKEVLELLGSLPEDDVRKRYTHQKAMEFLSGEQPEDFTDYLNSLEKIPSYAEEPLLNLAQQIVERSDPEVSMHDATAWLLKVEDREMRNSYIGQIAGNFRYQHPEHYDQWLSSFNFENEAERSSVLEEIQAQVDFLRDINSKESIKELEANKFTSPFDE